jgi:electron transfer flavoprotein beta subunit
VRIAVCLKRVPDTTSKIVLGADGQSIDETGLKFVPNPYDEFALEEALKLREAEGAGSAGEVVAITVGPDATQETLRTALATGADRAIQLQTSGSADGLVIAQALAAELKGGNYDLILFGKLAVDDYNHQVGVMVAELLELPCVTAISKLALSGGKLEAEREIEGGIETATASLPAVLTCDKGLNTPRLPSLKGIMAAKKKPLETRPVTLGAASLTSLGLALPAERKAGRIVGEGPDAVAELVRLLRAEAKVI